MLKLPMTSVSVIYCLRDSLFRINPELRRAFQGAKAFTVHLCELRWVAPLLGKNPEVVVLFRRVQRLPNATKRRIRTGQNTP